MTLPPDIQELIEQYLNGQLQGEALQNFEKRIGENTELAKEVAFQREMHHFLAETPENDLRKTLQMLSDQVVEPKEAEDSGWFWWLWPATGETNMLDWLFGHPVRHLAWVLPLLLVAGWWLFNQNDLDIKDPTLVGIDTLEHKERIDNPEEIIAVDPISPEIIREPEPIKPEGTLEQDPTPFVQEEAPAIDPKNKKEPPIIPHLESAPPINNQESPIYPQIDEGVMSSLPPAEGPSKTYEFYSPPTIYWDAGLAEAKAEYFNPDLYLGFSKILDSLVTATKQDRTYKIELIDYPEVIYLAENASWDDTIVQKVPLKLIIETDKDLFQQDPVLYVKDNQGNPYGPFPLLDSLQLDEENRYIVQTHLPLWDNTPRLVYYSIEDYETEELYFADKVAVLSKDSLFKILDFPMETGYSNLADLERRIFGEEPLPDFFAPNPIFEMAIKNNPPLYELKVTTQPVIPDTIYIPDSFFVYDANLPDAVADAQEAFKDSIFTFQLIVHTTENLFAEGLHYKVYDNLDFPVNQNYDAGYGIQKKYGTNAYFLDFKIGYASDYPEGLYYYQIYAGSKIFTGKYIILPVSARD